MLLLEGGDQSISILANVAKILTFIHQTYSTGQKYNNWLTRRDCEVTSFNLLHLLCPPARRVERELDLVAKELN